MLRFGAELNGGTVERIQVRSATRPWRRRMERREARLQDRLPGAALVAGQQRGPSGGLGQVTEPQQPQSAWNAVPSARSAPAGPAAPAAVGRTVRAAGPRRAWMTAPHGEPARPVASAPEGPVARGIARVTGSALGPYQTAVIRIGFAATWLLLPAARVASPARAVRARRPLELGAGRPAHRHQPRLHGADVVRQQRLVRVRLRPRHPSASPCWWAGAPARSPCCS